MASKVNTKFIVILSVVLVALAVGVGVLGALVVFKSADDHLKRGDRWSAEGNYTEAAKSYAKAVNKEPFNVAYLRKWVEAVSKSAPESDTDYRTMYQRDYLGALRQIATVLDTDPQAQRDFVDIYYRQMRLAGAGAEGWGTFIENLNPRYEQLDMTLPEAQSLLRYRGLASMYRFRTLDAVDQRERTRAREDLDRAFRADPTDLETALGRVELITGDAMSLTRSGRPQEGSVRWREAMEAIAEVKRRFPNSAQPLLREAIMRAELGSQTGASAEVHRELVASLEEALASTAALAKTNPAGAMDDTFLAQFSRATSILGTREAYQRWLDLLEELLSEGGFTAPLMMEKGRTLASVGRHEEAIGVFGEVVEMPNLPISIDGLILRELRVGAIRSQAESALALWAQASGADKEPAMERVKRYRDQLASRVASDSASMLRVNAQIAFAERRLDDAVDALSQLRRLTGGSDPEILNMLGRALEAQDKIGAAAQQYRRLYEMEPNNVQTLFKLLNLELRSGNRAEAQELILAAEKLVPGNEVIERAKQMIRVLEGAGLATDDPVMNVLNASLRMRTGANADLDKAAEYIMAGIAQFPNDPRLYLEQVTIETQAGRKDSALAMAREALKRFPEAGQFRQIEALLMFDDPVQARLQMVESLELPPIDRALARAGVFMGLNRETELEQELAAARAIDPDNPMLLEMMFVRSLTKRDFTTAQQLTQRAATVDADGVRGQLFQARLEIAQGKPEQAAATLDRITRESEFNIPAWRLLAQAQLESGRIDESMRSFDRALSIKPDDMPTINAYVSALRSLRRDGEALTLARRASQMRNADGGVANARLELEEQIGDARFAIDQRLRRRAGEPGDRANNLALARLFIREGLREQAGQILSEMRGAGNTPDLPLALVEARLVAATGSVREAAELIEREIQRLPEAQRGAGFVALSDFLFERQLPTEAVAALERARPTQGELMPVDRRLGDYFFGVGDFDRAVESYRRVIDSGADRDAVVAKRLVEAHMRTGRLDDAERLLSQIESGSSTPDVQTMLLRAQIALDKQQPLEARRLLDRAIETDPRNALAFIKRAQLGFADDSQFAAVLRDLRQASQLQPDNLTVRRMLSQLFLRRGRVNEAIDELAQAVRARPDNDLIRYEYIRVLGEHGRPDQMLGAIQQAVTERGDQAPQWFTMAGDAMLSSGDSARAIQLFERAHAISPNPSTLARLVDANLASRPPRVQQAAQSVTGFTPSNAQEQVFAMLLRGRIEATAGNQRPALQHFAQAWQQTGESSGMTRLWFEQTRRAFGENTRDMLAFIDQLPPQTAEGNTPAAIVQIAMLRADDPSQTTSALESLAGLERRTEDPSTLIELARIRGQIYYVSGDYAAAAEAYRAGLRYLPDDIELNNNLAYTIAKHLNQPQGALPYATKASELAPFNANVLDTLGLIYMQLGRNAQADATFARALDAATTDLERVPIHAHIAMVKQRLGDTAAASRNARLAVQLGESTPGAMQLYREEIGDARRIASGGQ